MQVNQENYDMKPKKRQSVSILYMKTCDNANRRLTLGASPQVVEFPRRVIETLVWHYGAGAILSMSMLST